MTRTRFCPTVRHGKCLHLGHVFNMLANIAFAKQHGGEWFYLIECDDISQGEMFMSELTRLVPQERRVIKHSKDAVQEADKGAGTTHILRGKNCWPRYAYDPGPSGPKVHYLPVVMNPGFNYRIGTREVPLAKQAPYLMGAAFGGKTIEHAYLAAFLYCGCLLSPPKMTPEFMDHASHQRVDEFFAMITQPRLIDFAELFTMQAMAVNDNTLARVVEATNLLVKDPVATLHNFIQHDQSSTQAA